jgi:hypothetical protein
MPEPRVMAWTAFAGTSLQIVVASVSSAQYLL